MNFLHILTYALIILKKARTIQELGCKKFQKLRTDYERSERDRKLEHKGKSDIDSPEKELKAEQRMKPNALVKKQMKKPMSRPLPEPVGSDFSAGATQAVREDLQNVSAVDQAVNCEMPSTTDTVLDSSLFLAENNLDKGEELSTGTEAYRSLSECIPRSCDVLYCAFHNTLLLVNEFPFF